jgi:predicted small lipoprotein YifL
MIRLLLTLSICLLMTNCGNKGDLYLPEANDTNLNSGE